MNTIAPPTPASTPIDTKAPLNRQAVIDVSPESLTQIYQESVNIAVWRRTYSMELQHSINLFLETHPSYQESMTLGPQGAVDTLYKALGNTPAIRPLSDDIALLIDMFCCLFELKQVGLRLTRLEKAMCPRFHVDHVPCRLVTTYRGAGTQWIPHHLVDRSKLGAGSGGQSDEQSGLVRSTNDIEHLKEGDVALLKGERWLGNENAGLVHRSPTTDINEPRLFLSFDFSGE